MKRKVAMQKLKNPKQTEQSKMKKIGKKTKENRKNVGEEKEGEESTQKEMVDREEIARKKAERQKKRVEQQKAKENKEREKAVKEKERAALMERDNRILAEMNSLARNLDVESKQPFTNLSDEEEYDVDRAEPMDDDEYFGGRDIISECSSYLHPPPLSSSPFQLCQTSFTNPKSNSWWKKTQGFLPESTTTSSKTNCGWKKAKVHIPPQLPKM